ncbi:uncharacterized protein LOC116252969 [Nymphaea colorata]|nr:uncharacterized protein LOC116252969 [Nymphaea colorata]XP_031483493.1 uncharacterized protein LOC116252969 [Nymphaea colorata]
MANTFASALMSQSIKHTPLPDTSSCTSLYYSSNLNSPLSKWKIRRIMDCRNAFHTLHVPRKWMVCATQTQSAIHLDSEEREKWDACKRVLCLIKLNDDEVDVILGKSFGWTKSPYWSEEKTKTLPNIELLNNVLGYLSNLGLSDDDIYKLLKKFPEVLGCELEGMKQNVETLDRQWGISGKSLRSLLLRNPKVLGYYVDCKGDCVAKCTRCWARF